MSDIPSLPLSRIVRVGEIAHDGKHLQVMASEEERARIAVAYGLLSVEALDADVVITQWGRGGLKVTGSLSAKVTQSCVVTLQPVAGKIEETFTRTFLPARAEKKRKRAGEQDQDIDIDFEEDDPPDILHGPELDLGEIILEALALGINPYPRHAKASSTVENSASSAEDDATPPSPFSVLKNLKK